MKKFAEKIIYQVNLFLGNVIAPLKQDSEILKQRHFETIQKALHQQSAVHIIYGNKSFTGDIVAFDQEKGRLVLKDFSNNIGSIIQINDIKRIKLVPDTIRKSQKL